MRPLIALVMLAAACGEASQVACTDDSSCATLAMPIAMSGARCCGGACVLPSIGCDSGWRYVTAEPLYGACVASSMCAPLDMSVPMPRHDMTLPSDLASQD